MPLHEGMNPTDMTESAPPVPGPEVIGHIAGDIYAAIKKPAGGEAASPDLREAQKQFAKDIAFAVVNELKNHAKITITIDAGPPPTATATLE